MQLLCTFSIFNDLVECTFCFFVQKYRLQCYSFSIWCSIPSFLQVLEDVWRKLRMGGLVVGGVVKHETAATREQKVIYCNFVVYVYCTPKNDVCTQSFAIFEITYNHLWHVLSSIKWWIPGIDGSMLELRWWWHSGDTGISMCFDTLWPRTEQDKMCILLAKVSFQIVLCVSKKLQFMLRPISMFVHSLRTEFFGGIMSITQLGQWYLLFLDFQAWCIWTCSLQP